MATLGYVFTQEYVRKSVVILAFVTIAFVFFSVANQRAMLRSQVLVVAAATELKAMGSVASTHASLKPVLGAYDAIAVNSARNAHYGFALVVVSAMWVLHFSQRT